VKTISREELKAKMDRGEDFILLEALGEASYRQAHLPGAIRLQDTGQVPDHFPGKSTEIIAYCSDFN
jgi:rhodanese-related sulfurtransferase